MKSKITTLFRKNHIKVTIEEGIPVRSPGLSLKGVISRYGSFSAPTYLRKEPKAKEITLESPLGFYYKKKVYTKDKPEVQARISNMELRLEIEPTTAYSVIYPSSYGSYSIGLEHRPWEIIPGDKEFPDHYIEDLKKEVDKILELAENKGIDTSETRRSIYNDLFGNPKGPRNMTDNEKILSHGFDLKESFRKRKE